MIGYLDRYLLRLTLMPLVATLGVAVLLLVLEQMLRLFDFVLSSDGPVRVVWQMLAFLVPQYFGLALPLGLLIGIMFAFRRISQGSELDAMQSSGVSVRRLLRTLMGLTVALMALNILVMGFLQPFSHYQYAKLKHEVRTGALGFSIQIGEFVTVGQSTTLRIAEPPDESGRFGDVFLEKCTAPGTCAAISAADGILQPTAGDGLSLRLFDGRQVAMEKGRFVAGTLRFAEQEVTVDLPDLKPFRPRGADREEATLPELFGIVASQSPATLEYYDEFRANLHWRLVHTASFLALPFLAIPLGIARRRGDTGLGPVLGIVLLVSYNEIVEAGRSYVGLGEASPWLSMWPAFIGFMGISVLFYYRLAERRGLRGDYGVLGRLNDLVRRFLLRGRRSAAGRPPGAAASLGGGD